MKTIAHFLRLPFPQRVPEELWPKLRIRPSEVWLCSRYMIQFFPERDGATRMMVNRPQRTQDGADWQDGITWDELQLLKSLTGRGHLWALEVYPKDDSLIWTANMRHLFLVTERPPFAWTNDHPTVQADQAPPDATDLTAQTQTAPQHDDDGS